MIKQLIKGFRELSLSDVLYEPTDNYYKSRYKQFLVMNTGKSGGDSIFCCAWFSKYKSPSFLLLLRARQLFANNRIVINK